MPGTWGDHTDHTPGRPLLSMGGGGGGKLGDSSSAPGEREAVTCQGRAWARSQVVSLALGLVSTGVGLGDQQREDLGAKF